MKQSALNNYFYGALDFLEADVDDAFMGYNTIQRQLYPWLTEH